MGRKTVERITGEKYMDEILQTALDILEADDGKTDEEKISDVVRVLRQELDPGLADVLGKRMVEEKDGREISNRFWRSGNTICVNDDLVLRKVREEDREKYLNVRAAYSMLKTFDKEEAYRTLLWSEHNQDTTLMFSILQNNAYVGYCGIHDTTKETWAIAIELQPEKTHCGIGFLTLSTMLNEIRDRLGQSAYRVRIEPTNYASQKLFEKLGAVPNRICELCIHDAKMLEECENEQLHLIDDHLIAVADKFTVPPRKLLSHVLEYSLIWK